MKTLRVWKKFRNFRKYNMASRKGEADGTAGRFEVRNSKVEMIERGSFEEGARELRRRAAAIDNVR